jgi:hypothetical protein
MLLLKLLYLIFIFCFIIKNSILPAPPLARARGGGGGGTPPPPSKSIPVNLCDKLYISTLLMYMVEIAYIKLYTVLKHYSESMSNDF